MTFFQTIIENAGIWTKITLFISSDVAATEIVMQLIRNGNDDPLLKDLTIKACGQPQGENMSHSYVIRCVRAFSRNTNSQADLK